MIRARSPAWRAPAPACWLLVWLLLPLAPGLARAAEPDDARCDEGAQACDCEQDASCWDFSFLSLGKSALFGLTATLSNVNTTRDHELDVGLLASYRADVHRSRGLLNGYMAVRAAIGAGSAGNEGELDGAVEFGVRLPVSTVSGPVLRVGPSLSLIGHDALQLGMLEPLRVRAGYQQLTGDALLESGLTGSLIGVGRFAAGRSSASLTGSLALGHYLAAHLGVLRFDGRVLYVQPSPFGAEVELGAIELALCGRPGPIALCADARYMQSRLPSHAAVANAAREPPPIARVLYLGLTAALTP